jgi:hypothetical protein
VVLYECETWSLALREKYRLRVFKNRALRRIFVPKRGERTGGWIELHNEELHDLYSSPSIIIMMNSRRLRWAGRVSRMERRRTRIGYWWHKPEGKRSLGRPRRRWVDNIKMDLGEIG